VNIPVLRKDFIFEPYQVFESAAFNADAILLIAALLDEEDISDLMSLASRLSLACLVEAHTREEVRRALDAGATIIGINNRDLDTFEVDITTTGVLRKLVPEHCTIVSESGIRTREDMQQLKGYGVNDVLVGESLVTSSDIPATMKELIL
jgi:indole-3-glycerol phosphate synthase